MGLLERYLWDEKARMMRKGVRLMAIGERDRLPSSVRSVLETIIDVTKDNKRITVNLALSYSGRHDIVKMVRQIARNVKDGNCDPEEIDEAMITSYTETASIPNPDLLIRTSGEMRISNFFLWQIPYTELYVTPVLWPDFREAQYVQALVEFQRRKRRFGRTDEQEI